MKISTIINAININTNFVAFSFGIPGSVYRQSLSDQFIIITIGPLIG